MGEEAGKDTTGTRPTVFLSYSHADQARAGELAAALEATGLDVWWDSLIEGGAAYARTIESALERCDAVVVLWSKASVASDWVLDEAGRGRDLRKLVPLSLDGTEPPLGFRQYQAVNLAAWRGDRNDPALAGVVRAVATVARHEGTPSRAAVPAAATPPARRRFVFGAVLGTAVLASGALVWLLAGRRQAGAPLDNSIAVLPFDNLSGDAAQAYFSEGLSEEVRATLARNLRLKVMAQVSASQFRASTEPAPAIARELGVAFLLDGSVRRAGDVVRIAADLIDGETGFSRWSNTFERRVDDVFAVQAEIANAVAAALAATLSPEDRAGGERDRAAAGGTQEVAAYDAYLRGRAQYELSADEDSERAALASFDAALAIDQGYAAAHAARARSLTTIANLYGSPGENRPMYDAAIASAERAVELAPGLAEAHSTLGFILFQGRLDARAGRAPFERSRTLGAGESTVMARFAQYSARCGRASDAAAAMAVAVGLDPLNPLIHRAAGSIEFAARRFAESIAPLERALAMNPRMTRASAAIGDALLMLGRDAEARARYLAEPFADVRLAGLAIVERRLGDLAAATRARDELVGRLGDRVLYQQAQVHAQWGEGAAALACLERARVVGDSGLIYLRNDPFLDPLRADPRYARLLEGIGFDPA